MSELHWTDCYLDDDNGSLVYAVEPGTDAEPGQSLSVRVGPVFTDGGLEKEPGIWVEYQEEHANCPPAGPVLLTAATWRALNRAVERRLRRRQPLWKRYLTRL